MIVGAEGVEPVQIAHDESAAGLVRRKDFQLVAFRKAIAAQEVQVLRIVGRSFDFDFDFALRAPLRMTRCVTRVVRPG